MNKFINAAKKLFYPNKKEKDIFGSRGNGKDCPICGKKMKPRHRRIVTGNFPEGMHDYCWPESFKMALEHIQKDLEGNYEVRNRN